MEIDNATTKELLRNMACPECGNADSFEIEYTDIGLFTKADIDFLDTEEPCPIESIGAHPLIEGSSICNCTNDKCLFRGLVSDFVPEV